jgi:hypothetical protein
MRVHQLGERTVYGEAAQAAVRSDEKFGEFYERYAERKGYQRLLWLLLMG